jgi:uncharacterized RDD family membrane protein YckC
MKNLLPRFAKSRSIAVSGEFPGHACLALSPNPSALGTATATGLVSFASLLLALWFVPHLSAQTPAAEVEPPGITELSDIVVMGKDVVLKKNETAPDVVVIFGNANIEGKVKNDLVVIMGTAKVSGEVDGDLVVVMGSASLSPGAHVRHDLVTVGGKADLQPSAKVDGSRTEIAFPKVPGFHFAGDWVKKGLFLARPLPPKSIVMWGLAGLFLVIYLLLSLIFPRPVQACVAALEERPIGSFLIGALTFLLLGPVLFLLLVSAIGILVIPFLMCALLVALLFGKTAVFRQVGVKIGRSLNLDALQTPMLALVVGAVLFYLLYTVPVLGFVIWGIITPLGLGAVMLAAVGSFHHEIEKNAPLAAIPAFNPLPPVQAASSSPEMPPPPPAIPEALTLPRVGFGLRFAATLIDLLLVSAVLAVVPLPPIHLMAWVIYHVAMWAWKSTTVGGIVLGLKCVRIDGSPVTFSVALIRTLAAFLSGVPCFLGFFWLGWDKEKQSWHDKIAGTTIVKVPQGSALI